MPLASRPEATVPDLDAAARAAAGGDRAAFERLYRGTVGRVHALARRLLGPARAEEATQEAYLRAWRALPSWRGEAQIGTWLHRLARNAFLNLLARRELATDDDVSEVQAAASGADVRLELDEAIARLPEGARRVFVLHDVEGFSHVEIAARLGLAVGTSKSQLHRARLLLRAALHGPTS